MILTISDFPAPKEFKELQRFLDMCRYYTHFINMFSELALPALLLLKIQNMLKFKFRWSKALFFNLWVMTPLGFFCKQFVEGFARRQCLE